VIVVDTNVIAYLFIPCEFTALAEKLFRRDPDWLAPLLWRSELRNVLATQVRRRSLTLALAVEIQAEAEELMAGREYQVPSADVLRLAAESGGSA
jgi:predicted nucleic acid-binding protein